MKELSFEQRIALQMGELILEVKRLETIRDQMADQLSKLGSENSKGKFQSPHEISNPPPS
jgi:hypothetical protein